MKTCLTCVFCRNRFTPKPSRDMDILKAELNYKCGVISCAKGHWVDGENKEKVYKGGLDWFNKLPKAVRERIDRCDDWTW